MAIREFVEANIYWLAPIAFVVGVIIVSEIWKGFKWLVSRVFKGKKVRYNMDQIRQFLIDYDLGWNKDVYAISKKMVEE